MQHLTWLSILSLLDIRGIVNIGSTSPSTAYFFLSLHLKPWCPQDPPCVHLILFDVLTRSHLVHLATFTYYWSILLLLFTSHLRKCCSYLSGVRAVVAPSEKSTLRPLPSALKDKIIYPFFFLYTTVYSRFCGFTTLSGIWLLSFSLTKLHKWKEDYLLYVTTPPASHIMNVSTNEFICSSKLSFKNLRNTYNCLLELLWIMCRHSKLGHELIIPTHTCQTF